MKIKEYFSYSNEKFAFLREPMRNLVGAFSNAEKWFATLKEWTLIEMGMPFLTDIIHRLEHVQPERLDIWTTAYRSWHLPLEYPATPELAEEINDMDKLFEICVNIIDEIDEALMKMITATAGGEFNALALATENLKIENALDKTRLMTLWTLWDNGADPAAFDIFAAEFANGGVING